MELRLRPAKGLRGEIDIPGDKSISHRAIMFGALSQGITTVENFLLGADCLSTISCFRKLGVSINQDNTYITIEGKGIDGLEEPKDFLDAGNSGTTMRLMMGILSGQGFFTTMTGDESLRSRPMGRVAKPLREMGAQIWGRKEGNYAPLAIKGGGLKPIHYSSPVASAQVKSAILLAGLYCQGQTSVTEPTISRDHTERMLSHFGAKVSREGKKVTVEGRPTLKGCHIIVPGDISSAAFFLVAGTIVPNSEILLKNVGINPTRDGIIPVLKSMGAKIEIKNERDQGGEPVADLLVKSSELKGIEISGEIIPRLIDEIPIIAVAASQAQGITVIRDAEELRVKESDRIKVVAEELGKFGVKIEEQSDGMIIHGGGKLKGANCESHHDHRIAMAMSIAALVSEGESQVNGAEAIDVSYPNFIHQLEALQDF